MNTAKHDSNALGDLEPFEQPVAEDGQNACASRGREAPEWRGQVLIDHVVVPQGVAGIRVGFGDRDDVVFVDTGQKKDLLIIVVADPIRIPEHARDAMEPGFAMHPFGRFLPDLFVWNVLVNWPALDVDAVLVPYADGRSGPRTCLIMR